LTAKRLPELGQHFNGPGHSLENLKITATEKVFKRGTATILKRESLWINLFEASTVNSEDSLEQLRFI
jgi:hypothetical protein